MPQTLKAKKWPETARKSQKPKTPIQDTKTIKSGLQSAKEAKIKPPAGQTKTNTAKKARQRACNARKAEKQVITRTNDKIAPEAAIREKCDKVKLKKLIRVFNSEESTHTMPDGLELSAKARTIVQMASTIPGYSILEFLEELTPLIILSCLYTPKEIVDEFELDSIETSLMGISRSINPVNHRTSVFCIRFKMFLRKAKEFDRKRIGTPLYFYPVILHFYPVILIIATSQHK